MEKGATPFHSTSKDREGRRKTACPARPPTARQNHLTYFAAKASSETAGAGAAVFLLPPRPCSRYLPWNAVAPYSAFRYLELLRHLVLTWLNVPGSPSAFSVGSKVIRLRYGLIVLTFFFGATFSSVLLERAPDVRLALSSANSPHQRLLDCEFRLCLKFEDGAQCPVCHTVVDPYGDHHVGCGGNGDRHPALEGSFSVNVFLPSRLGCHFQATIWC